MRVLFTASSLSKCTCPAETGIMLNWSSLASLRKIFNPDAPLNNG